jgi:hypothetical protein
MFRNRVVAAAVVVAAGIGVPGSALAFGSGGSGSKPTTAPAATAPASKATGSSGTTGGQKVPPVGQLNHSLTGPEAVAALATQLGVSTAAAQSALQQLSALASAQGIDPNGAAFAAIAHHLGVTPTRLAAALPLVKQAMRPAGA